MRSPTLPVQSIDAQAVLATSPSQPPETLLTQETLPTQSITPIVVNSIIALLVLCLFGMIIRKKRRNTLLRQRIQLLEKLWLLESRSPFEEQK